VGTKNLQLGLLAVLDNLELLLVQRFAARTHVDVVGDAVKLQVQRVQAGFLALISEIEVGELDAVGGDLYVREAHFLGETHRLEEVRIDGRLAA